MNVEGSLGVGEDRGRDGRRNYHWARRPRMCGRSESDVDALPPGPSPHRCGSAVNPQFAPPNVLTNRNTIPVPKSRMYKHRITGERRPVMPVSAFFDSDSTQHVPYYPPNIGDFELEPEPQPVVSLLQEYLDTLDLADSESESELEIADDPVGLLEMESLPPTPTSPTMTVSPLNTPSASNTPSAPIMPIIPPFGTTPRSNPTITQSAVVHSNPRLAFSVDNQIHQQRKGRSWKAWSRYWHLKKEQAAREVQSDAVSLTFDVCFFV